MATKALENTETNFFVLGKMSNATNTKSFLVICPFMQTIVSIKKSLEKLVSKF